MDKGDTYKNLKDFSKLLREVGQDMIRTSDMTDEYLRKARDPLEIIFNRNLSDELDEMTNAIYVNNMMISNKLSVLTELMSEFGEKGEE